MSFWTTSLDCPPKEFLARFGAGTLSEELAEELAEHLDHCTHCQKAIAEVDVTAERLVPHFKHTTGSFTFGDEAECWQATSLVRRIGRDSTPSDAGFTVRYESTIEQFGHYRLLEKLGQGGMGTVYKARHTKLKKIVAIKVLPFQRMNDPQAVARFQREIELVGKLDHPHIVRAMDAGEVDGIHFLVMEFIDGVDLSQLSQRLGPLPIADACELIRQAAEGLEEAFANGLVHRDVKPSNLMLAQRPRQAPVVKVLDLGLAMLAKTGFPAIDGLTKSDQVLGTLDYMAPEQGGDGRHVDIRADVYSLGATLYRLLTGEVIFGSSGLLGAGDIAAHPASVNLAWWSVRSRSLKWS